MASARKDRARASGADLYEKLDLYYADMAREIYLDAPHDSSSLVYYLITCAQRFFAGGQALNHLLNYVNRHYVRRTVDEDKGWLQSTDILEAVAHTLQHNDTRDDIRKRIKERRTEELKKWGYHDEGSPDLLVLAEACAEAASPLD